MSRYQQLGDSVIALDVSAAYQQGSAAQQPSLPLSDHVFYHGEYEPWGRCGNLPTIWREKLEESTIAAQAFYKQANIAYGRGVSYYREVEEDNRLVRKYIKDDAIDSFFRKNKMDQFLLKRLYDYVIHGNIFCEFILNKSRNRILNVRHLDAEFCRLAKLSKEGIIPHIGYGPDFRYNLGTDYTPTIIDIELLDEYEYIQQINESGKYKYSLWSKIPISGRIYYARPPWSGLFKENGWMDVSSRVPRLISVLQKNQTKIKYIIRINETVWKRWYPDWDDYSADKRATKTKEKKKELEELLIGVENDLASIKSFISVTFRNPVTGEAEKGIEVEAVDDKLKTADWVPDSQAADQQIVQTIGLDPSETGLQPSGGKMGAGSGSDKRVSRINSIGINSSLEKVIFEPLEIIRDFNQWPEDIKFTFTHALPTTLDRNPQGITEKENEY